MGLPAVKSIRKTHYAGNIYYNMMSSGVIRVQEAEHVQSSFSSIATEDYAG
jgi:hypothetical protein